MNFEWDPAKSDKTLRERGFGFPFASRIVATPVIETIDGRLDYGEARIQAIGEAEGDILFVVYTDRRDTRWIISARKASRKERAKWRMFAER